MNEAHLVIPKQARYYTLGELTPETEQVWFVAHGYGQLANYFLKRFELLDLSKNFVVAPEGLHRFYLKGFGGRVGASWMTKEDRLTDIEDYINFLNQLYETTLGAVKHPVKVNVLGFSQGAATVSRWICAGKVKADNFILWAGVFPDDVAFEVNKSLFDGMSNWLLYGDKDEFAVPERLAAQKQVLEKHGISYTLLPFEGTHRVEPAALIDLEKRLYADSNK